LQLAKGRFVTGFSVQVEAVMSTIGSARTGLITPQTNSIETVKITDFIAQVENIFSMVFMEKSKK